MKTNMKQAQKEMKVNEKVDKVQQFLQQAEKRSNNLDQDLIRDVELCTTNTEKFYKPLIEYLNKRYKQGSYNSILALKQCYNVAYASLTEYLKESDMKVTNKKAHAIAIARIMLNDIERCGIHKQN